MSWEKITFFRCTNCGYITSAELAECHMCPVEEEKERFMGVDYGKASETVTEIRDVRNAQRN